MKVKSSALLLATGVAALLASVPAAVASTSASAHTTTSQGASPLAQPAAVSSRTQVLQTGDSGSAVLALNQRLLTLHFLPGSEGSTYGAATTDAVIAFQKWEGLPRDGVAGPKTQARLAKATPPTPLLKESGKRVEVSISKQVGLEVNGGRVLWVFPVSTARPGYVTPLGRFHIFSKYLDSWSVPYQEWMPYASYFNGGIALHGLDSVPVYPASHGCVRVPLVFAPVLYKFDTIGTEVDVLP